MTCVTVTDCAELAAPIVLRPMAPDESFYLECSFEVFARWQPDTYYAVNAVVRPPVPNGFEYRVTTAGRSARRPPTWPIVDAGTVAEGILEWEAQAPSDASLLRELTGTPVWSIDDLTITDQSRVGQLARALINGAGGEDGEDYLITVTGIYLDGTVANAYAILPIRVQTAVVDCDA